MGVPNAVLFRAWDFHAPPPIAAEAMAAAAGRLIRAPGLGRTHDRSGRCE